MKKTAYLSVFISMFSANLMAKEVLVDRLCAWVDSEPPILLSEIKEKIENGPLVRFSDYSPNTENTDEFTRALNDSINGRLILRRAKELDIRVDDEQVDTQIEQMSGMKKEAIKAELVHKNRSYEDYKSYVHDQMVFGRFKGREIIPKIKISDQDLENYYIKKQGSSSEAAEILVGRINIPFENSSFYKAKQDLAHTIYADLNSGKLTFEEAQKLYSKEISSKPLETYQLKDLELKIRNHLKDLKTGDYAPPIELPARSALGEFVIFYIADKRLIGGQEFARQKKALEGEFHAIQVINETNHWLQMERSRSNITVIKE